VSWLRYAARRTAFAAFATLVVITLTFLLVDTAGNTNLGALIASMQRNGASQAEIEAAVRQYRATRGLTGSMFDRWVRFVVGAVTMDWGYSAELRRPVEAVLLPALVRTLAYVVPAVLFAYTLGVLGGLTGAFSTPSRDWGSRLLAYAAVGLPTFLVGWIVADLLHGQFPWVVRPGWTGTPFLSLGRPALESTTPWRPVTWHYLLPGAVLSIGLVAGLLRHMRNAALEYRGSSAQKMLDAKGASTLLSARHALRNAALLLLTVSFGELISVLAIGSFVVETVFRIPGLAAYTMIGAYTRDYYLIVATAAIYAFIGICGTLLQDLLYGYLDPTIREG
jgi:peptide/nickel transport system permease protein